MKQQFEWIPEAVIGTLKSLNAVTFEIELGVPHPPKFKDIESDDLVVHKQFLEDRIFEGAKTLWRQDYS
ncbi:MAG: hypothetical protein R2883_08490 [Caldisericia bacterium]